MRRILSLFRLRRTFSLVLVAALIWITAGDAFLGAQKTSPAGKAAQAERAKGSIPAAIGTGEKEEAPAKKGISPLVWILGGAAVAAIVYFAVTSLSKKNSPASTTTTTASNTTTTAGTTSTTTSIPASNYDFISALGAFGGGLGQFNNPCDVAANAAERVYVVDSSNNRVQESSPNMASFQAEWGGFNAPGGIGIGPEAIYVAGNADHRIYKFSVYGEPWGQWGGPGSGDAQFSNPRDVAVDGSGYIYIADTGNHRIQKYRPAGVDGGYEAKWGGPGAGNGQFNSPTGITIDSAGNVYVADSQNHRIQKFDTSGTFLAAWGSFGANDGQFNTPRNLAVDAQNNVYVADTGNHRIQKFTSSGTFINKLGSQGTANGQFQGPWGVAVTSSGSLYVADTGNQRIQKFRIR